MRKRIVSVWCLPCAEDERRYADVISSLTAMSGTPMFLPHLTLGSLKHHSDLTGLVKEAFSLEPIEIDGNTVFTTSLFVRFRISDPLRRTRQKLEGHRAFRPGRAFDPHLSLHYGAAPLGAMDSQKVTALLDHRVRFDRLAMIEMDVPIEDQSAIQAWRTLEIIGLERS